MAFGSNGFPLGPNGQYPKQRVSSYNTSDIAPPNRVEDVYTGNRGSKLPAVEKDFGSSINKAKWRMKQGSMMRQGQDVDKFRPRGAGKSKIRRAEEKDDNWLKQRGNKFPGLQF